jgi:hypothetical protein
LVGVVGVVEVVVEFDSVGPDSLGLYTTAAAPAMMRPAKQLTAKSLRFMITLGSRCAPSVHPHSVHEWSGDRVQNASR